VNEVEKQTTLTDYKKVKVDEMWAHLQGFGRGGASHF